MPAGGDRSLSGAGDGRGRDGVFDRRVRSSPVWKRCAPSEKDLMVKDATVEGVAVNLAAVKKATVDLVAVNLATVVNVTTNLVAGNLATVMNVTVNLVAVKNMAVKAVVSDLVGLGRFSDLPEWVVVSDLAEVGFRGAFVLDLGGWSTATEPP